MTALITGVTRGIGRECAIELKEKGYEVIGTYLRSEAEADQLRNMGITAVKCDSRSFEAVHSLAADCGNVSVLVNNAGIAEDSMFTDITEEMWDNMFAVNCKGVYNFCHAFAPQMIRRKYGRIINISSIWGEVGAACEVHYSAAKAAVIGFTKALAKELAPSGITVNCITPGVIDTDMNSIYDEDTMHSLVGETPVGRLGTPADIANTVAFLISERSSFITGQVIGVNGLFGC